MNHSEITTYDLHAAKNGSADFNLKKMEDLYDQHLGQPDRPHRHNYFTLLLIKKAKGKHYVDFKEHRFTNNSLHFVYPGQVHQPITSTRPEGWVLNFSRFFLIKNGIGDEIINDVYLYTQSGETPPIPIPDEEFKFFETIIYQMAQYVNNKGRYHFEALGALLKLFLIRTNQINANKKEDTPHEIETNHLLIRKFKQEVEASYKQSHKVSFYASKLNITADYLNKSIKVLTGKTPKEHIQNRLLIEAKRLLLFTDLSNKELSYELGYEEPAHFSNFFKKHNQISPILFREKSRNY